MEPPFRVASDSETRPTRVPDETLCLIMFVKLGWPIMLDANMVVVVMWACEHLLLVVALSNNVLVMPSLGWLNQPVEYQFMELSAHEFWV